jgi:hypothetical protein
MEDFVTFELAKKLKEKGFDCSEPFAMYNELGVFHKLYSSADFIVGYSVKCRDYYDYEDFDDRDYVCPTISQVLKWLREEKSIFVEPCVLADADTDADGKVINEYTYWSFTVTNIETGDMIYFEYERIDDKRFDSYEQAAIAGIEYCLDNLI